MAIYVFNLLVGYAPNGVDNAQGKRDKYLKELNVPIKYIFTEAPYYRYIRRYNKLGIDIKDMLSVHLSFTDNKDITASNDLEQKVKELYMSMSADTIRKRETTTELLRNGSRLVSIDIDKEGKNYTSINFYDKERLVHSEVYCGNLLYTDDYITACDKDSGAYAKRILRSFKNQNGSTAFDVYYNGNKETYIFPDGSSYSKCEFLNKFFANLQLTKEDIILIDRASELDFIQPLLESKGEAKIICFLHSANDFFPGEDNSGVNINREYFTLFRYAQSIYSFVVSTGSQKDDLIRVLKENLHYTPNVTVIPVAGIDTLRYADKPRKNTALLSVSRMDERKRIHWIMRATAIAHKENPNIQLDIYGRGEKEYEQTLEKLLNELDAREYIHFKGQHDVKNVYRDYKVFISASIWETLGLSVLEAIGSGDAIIGLNVRYGNRELIKHHRNGILVDFDVNRIQEPKTEEITVGLLAKAIIEAFEDENVLKQYEKNSYAIANGYLDEKIKEQWMYFIQTIIGNEN